ncbi:hypothetical protein TYRP_010149 [Tyrophagus putrescentiae]|nr:hypothetical protein TYRP_010149 [Tyrophagus putrescentiae]
MSKVNDEGEKKVVKLTPMKDGKTFLMAPADYRNLFEKDKEPKEAKEKGKEPKESKEPKDGKDDSKISKADVPNTGGSSLFGKATVPDADDGISKRQSSKLKRSDSKNSLKKVKRSTPAFADKDHPPNKKSQERLHSHSHGRHNRSHSSHSHGHGHKSSADNKKSRSKKSLHSQKNGSKNKGSGSKDQPVTMSIGTMTVINYGGSSDGPLPKGVPGVPGSKANPEPSPPPGLNRGGEKADNSKAG